MIEPAIRNRGMDLHPGDSTKVLRTGGEIWADVVGAGWAGSRHGQPVRLRHNTR